MRYAKIVWTDKSKTKTKAIVKNNRQDFEANERVLLIIDEFPSPKKNPISPLLVAPNTSDAKEIDRKAK